MPLKQRCGLPADPLYLVDGTAFVYRAFYANRALQRADGHPTGALYVTTRLILRLLRAERPTHAVFFMDSKGPHFRHALYPRYKANREATPQDLLRQIEPVQRMVRALGLCLEIPQGCEADDGIASITARFAQSMPVVIVGADKDLRQCLAPNVLLWDPSTNVRDEKLLTLESFIQDTGLRPDQWPDLQALAGDSSDNIPGVPGVGLKTAAQIIATLPTLEDIRDRIQTLGPKLRDKIAPHMDKVFLYRELTRLDTTRCAYLDIADMTVQPVNREEALALLHEFELHSLVREVESMARTGTVPARTLASDTLVPSSLTLGQEHTQQAQQGMFFDTPHASHTPPALPVAPSRSSIPIQDLPACKNLPVALLPCALLGTAEDAGYILAVGECEVYTTLTGDTLAPLLSQAAQIVTPDLKWLLHHDRHEGAFTDIPLELWFDLSLAAYVCNPEERDYDWSRLARRIPPTPISPISPISGEHIQQGSAALAMAAQLAGLLAERHLDALYYDIELPLIPVLVAMEQQGIAIDTTVLGDFLREVLDRLETITRDIYALAGGAFNIRSSQQLSDVLFRTLQLPTAGKTPKGQLSTAQAALETLAGKHPLVDAVLEFRKLEKLRSTYLEPLPKLADTHGRIHTTFNQKATATGRLSSSNPNLQNIPIRGDLGQRMRSCFVAAPGHALISADYSQIEVRVLAHMSQDPVLLDAFAQAQDIHRRTAALIYGCPPDAVSTEQRRNAKTINFGLIYGMGAHKLGHELRVSLAEAKAFIESYFKHLKGLKEFYEAVENTAKEHGYVVTLAGRRRFLPDIRAANHQLQSLARRQAINTVIQGSAADIIKLAMLAVATDPHLETLNARLILQVHDELLLEVPTDRAQEAGERVVALMKDVRPDTAPLSVPLLVDWGIARAWKEAR